MRLLSQVNRVFAKTSPTRYTCVLGGGLARRLFERRTPRERERDADFGGRIPAQHHQRVVADAALRVLLKVVGAVDAGPAAEGVDVLADLVGRGVEAELLHGPHHDQDLIPNLPRAAGLESGGFEQIVKAGQRFLSRPGRHLIGGEERLQIREDQLFGHDLPESEVVPHPRSGAGRAG